MEDVKNLQEQQTLLNSGFRYDEELTIKITGRDFALLSGSSDFLFSANVHKCRPIRYKHYDKNGELVLEPTREQIDNNELSRVFDPVAFMGANNLIDAYIGDLSPLVMEAGKVLDKIGQQGIDQGKAVPFETLIAEQEEANKSKLEVVNE